MSELKKKCEWCGSARHVETDCLKRKSFEETRAKGTLISPPEYEEAHEQMRGLALYMKRTGRRFVVAEMSEGGKLKMLMCEDAPPWWPVIGGAS